MQRHGRTSKIAQSHTTEKTRDREQTEKGTERQKQPSQKPPQSIPPKKNESPPQDKKKPYRDTIRKHPRKREPYPPVISIWTSCTHRLTAAAFRRNLNVFDGV